MQSVPIITNVESSNAAHGEMYSIQHFVKKLISDLRRQWVSPGTPVSSTNKTDNHDITEILLKVALNIVTLTLDKCTGNNKSKQFVNEDIDHNLS